MREAIFTPTPISSSGGVFSSHDLETSKTKERIKNIRKKFKILDIVECILLGQGDMPNVVGYFSPPCICASRITFVRASLLEVEFSYVRAGPYPI